MERKWINAALVIVAIVSVSFIALNKATTPKELGNAVFQAIQKESYQDYEKFLITEKDSEIIINNSNLGKEEKTQAQTYLKGLSNDMQHNGKQNFNDIIQEGKSKGIIWNRAKLDSLVCDIKSKKNIESGTVYIFGSCDTSQFLISLKQIHKSDQWVLTSRMKLEVE